MVTLIVKCFMKLVAAYYVTSLVDKTSNIHSVTDASESRTCFSDSQIYFSPLDAFIILIPSKVFCKLVFQEHSSTQCHTKNYNKKRYKHFNQFEVQFQNAFF